MLELIEVFKELRDVCDAMINALENEDEKAIEAALGRFVVTMMKLEALK